ncbi:FtsH protease activity modulator HflK [Zavarzinia sp. CC-PAN008]|uniref:FtsH protease activity modulator HflK n=1 Tax=Zavarzinia sp. CC-PAN008 TaxID=3243332 RepID=UPI003F744C49
MPWQNQGGGGWQSGGGGGNRGPWGQGPRGNGPQPPNLEELFRRGQDRFRGMIPGSGGGWGARGILVAAAALFALWMATGFYRVEPEEQGIVLTFGKWTHTAQPGLNWHWPAPIAVALTPKVLFTNQVSVGFTSSDSRNAVSRDVLEESQMLTGDENIIDIDFVVTWQIADPAKFLFNVQEPQEQTVKAVAESVMREVVGQTTFQGALTQERPQIERRVLAQIQQTLDSYDAGIRVLTVLLQDVAAPAQVVEAFRDVQSAQADMVRQQNEARAYANDIIPRARGDAVRDIQAAQAYRTEVVTRAQGDAARFLSVFNEFVRAREVIAERLFLETVEGVLSEMNKTILDTSGSNGGGTGAVPYLPLNELRPAPAAPAQSGAVQ